VSDDPLHRAYAATARRRAALLRRVLARPARTQQLSDHRSDQTGTSDTPHAEGRATGQDAPVARPVTGQALDITSLHPGAMPVAGDSPTDPIRAFLDARM